MPNGIPKQVPPKIGGEAQNEIGRQAFDVARGGPRAGETQDDRNERQENQVETLSKEKGIWHEDAVGEAIKQNEMSVTFQ